LSSKKEKMMVSCMASGDANKGIISKDECLACALKNGASTPCGYDYTLLKYIYSKERYEEQKIHVSDLLGCPRQAYLSKKVKLPTEAYRQLIVTFGTLQHQMLEEMQDKYYEAEKLLEYKGMVGTADVVYKDGRVIDYKTTRNMNPKYLPQKKHKMQVNIYAHMLREAGHPVVSATIQYIDFMGPSKCPVHKSFVVPGNKYPKCPICGDERKEFHLGAMLFPVKLLPDDEVEQLIEEKTAYLQRCLEEESIPEPEPDFLCRYCPFVSFCEEGRNQL